MTARIETYPSRSALMEVLSATVADELRAALSARGQATLAVPGGTTPGPFLTALSGAELDWADVSVMLTDERFVPESSERSNTRLLKSTLLQGRAAVARLLPFHLAAERPEDVLDELAGPVAGALPISTCVLGMGEDMHTASLFPGADRLAEALAPDAPILVPMRAPGAPEPRITLSAPVLRAAGSLHLLITGHAKLAALNAALEDGPVEDAPVRAILTAPGSVTVHFAE